MKKRILAGLMALCMLICMLPVVALAADPVVTIDGNTLADGESYNGATVSGSTLILSNATVYANIELTAAVTTIEVNNTVQITGGEGYGIYAEGALTIKGTGTLDILNGYGYAIYALGEIVIDGVDVYVDNTIEVGVYSEAKGVVSVPVLPKPNAMFKFYGGETGTMGDYILAGAGQYQTASAYEFKNGYMSVTDTNGDPYFMPSGGDVGGIGSTLTCADVDVMVIKYAASLNASDFATFGTIGQIVGGTTAKWNWEDCSGAWDVMTVYNGKTNVPYDGHDVRYSAGDTQVVPWADSTELSYGGLRLDPFGSLYVQGTFSVAYIAMFADVETAEAYAAAEERTLAIAAASGIDAADVYTQGGVAYTADEVVALNAATKDVYSLSDGYTQAALGSISRDAFYFGTAGTITLNHDEFGGSMQAYLFNHNADNALDVTDVDLVGLAGWIQNATGLTHIGYADASGAHLTAIDPSDLSGGITLADGHAGNLTNGQTIYDKGAGSKVWYDAGLATAIGASARRYWLEVPTSALAAGVYGIQFVCSLDGGTTVQALDINQFYVENNELGYDYLGDDGNQYVRSDSDLLVNGADSGLDLVTDGASAWGVAGYSIAVMAAGNGTYYHDGMEQTGYFTGIPYEITVVDTNGAPYAGATVNFEGSMLGGRSNADGVAVVYASAVDAYSITVTDLNGNVAYGSVPAGEFAATVRVNDTLPLETEVNALTIQNGAVLTVDSELAFLGMTESENIIVNNAALVTEGYIGGILIAENVAIESAQVAVGETLTMNYYVSTYVPGMTMEVTMNEVATTLTVEVTEDGYVAAFEGITPQCMGDALDAVVFVGGVAVATKTGYSVKDNLVNLAGVSTSYDLKTLIADLLCYGAAAQSYMGYKTEALVTATVDSSIMAYASSEIVPTEYDNLFALSTGTDAGTYFKAASVYFDNINKIRVKFYAADINAVTVTANGAALAIEDAGNGMYYAYTDALTALQFADAITFSLSVNDVEVQTLTYSVNTYAYRMAENSSVANLAVALYRYGLSAAIYAGI